MTEIPYWNDTVTVLNKLSGKDSITKIDTWKKTILHNCYFRTVIQRDVGQINSEISQSAVCRIPKNPDFKPYYIWKENISDGFTLNTGDYIFKGEINEEITAENIVKIYNSHKPAMLVKAVSDNSNFLGFGEHYRAEGV